jgi:hypothetical protein
VSRDPFADNSIVLSEDEQAAIQAWVDDAKKQLALSDWSIVVSRHASEKEALASSFIRDHADESIIALASEFREWTADEIRHALTHELLHPHFQRVTLLAQKLIETELGKRTEAVIEAACREVEELSIDRLAGAVARFLPPVKLPETTNAA